MAAGPLPERSIAQGGFMKFRSNPRMPLGEAIPRMSQCLPRLGSGGARLGPQPIALLLVAAIAFGWTVPVLAAWHLAVGNAGAGTVTDIAIAPSNPIAIYNSTEYGGIFKSPDGGKTWKSRNVGLTGYWVNCLAIHPSQPTTLYAGTRGQGIFKTTDGGDTWVQVHRGDEATSDVTAVEVNPLTPNSVFAGTWGGGVLKSQDAGATWKKVNTGLAGNNLYIRALALAIASASPKTLYVATWGVSNGGGVHKTTNGGASWSPVNSGIPTDSSGVVDSMYDIAVAPSAPSTLYAGSAAGMYKSTNGGAKWRLVHSVEGYYSIAIHPQNASVVYAGSLWNGAYKSADGGASWSAINSGMPPSSPYNSNHEYETYDPPFALEIDPASPSTVYAGTIGSGIYVQYGRPSAPTEVKVDVRNGEFVVSFAPPASSGGTPIVSYTATPYLYVAPGYADSGLPMVSGATSPMTLRDLAAKTRYGFAVAAKNAVGSGPESVPVNGILTVPGMPTAVAATRGNGEASVSFAAPASDGGAPIVSYRVARSGMREAVATGTSSPIVARGLANGTPYTFRVFAVNAIGAGTGSVASNTVTPARPPDPPTQVSAVAGHGEAKVSFLPPANDGGDPVASYKVLPVPGHSFVTGAASPIAVTGLANGTAYTFMVYAVNGAGTSAASLASDPVTPQAPTVPGEPTLVSAVAGNGEARVSFVPPESDGGSPIGSYRVTSAVGSRVLAIGTASPIAVTGLANGTAYSFCVRAVNTVGAGPASTPSNTVTPSPRAGPLGAGG
jgi:photosystem II stability/assembly factor-like uncharacterized protein